MIDYIFYAITAIVGFLCVFTFLDYLRHPFVGTGLVEYTGGKLWIVFALMLIAIYLKT